MKVKCAILVGILCMTALTHDARSQTKFDLAEEKITRKREGKKPTPTFVGSDGIVRKVSPAAILEEMKRCLPLGLSIPITTAWPELPPHLEDLQEEKESRNELPATHGEDPVNVQKDSEEKKRVSRSNGKIGDIGVDAGNDQSMNVKLEGPMKETSIFSPKDINQNKMAEVLKDMLSRQMRRQNLTAEYVDDFAVRTRLHKAKPNDYEDYDYVDPEEPKTVGAKANRSTYRSSPFQMKRQRKSKRRNKWRNGQRKTVERRQMNRRKKSDYDYDYEESHENTENHQYSRPQQVQSTRANSLPEDPIQSDELEKQIELNDILEKNLNNGIPERMENIDKFIKGSGNFKMRLGENMDVLEGYQKMLAVVMKLNTKLIRLLDKLSTQKSSSSSSGTLQDARGSCPDSGRHNDDSKSAVIWDFMDLLMEQRRGARKKRENGPYVPEHAQAGGGDASLDGNPTTAVRSPPNRTNADLLKWLLKWYLNSTSL